MLEHGNRLNIQTEIHVLTIVDLILIDHRQIKEYIDIFVDLNVDKRKKLSVAKSFLDIVSTHLKAESAAVYGSLKKIEFFRFSIMESLIEHEIIEQKVKKLKPPLAKARSLKDEVEAELKVLAELLRNHIMEEESVTLPKIKVALDNDLLRQMGLEFMKLRKFSAEDLKDYPQLQDELVQWKDSIQKVSSEFLSRMDKFVENLQH